MRYLIHLFLSSILLSATAQESKELSIEQVHRLPVSQEAIFTTDLLENIYLSEDGSIHKYDSTGTLRYTQSIKSNGRLTEIEVINSMKIIQFSDEQQRICFFDNTLSKTENCIDLADLGIYNAQHIAASNRPEKLWVFDGTNSRLILIDLSPNKLQQIESTNLKGVLNLTEVKKIIERESRLYLFDQQQGIFIFDLYGTLIDLIEEKNLIDFTVMDQTILAITSDQLLVIDPIRRKKQAIELPIHHLRSIKTANKRLFLQTDDFVYKYRFQF